MQRRQRGPPSAISEVVRRYAQLAPAQMTRNAAVIDAYCTTQLRHSAVCRANKKGTTEQRNPLIQQYKYW